MVPTKKKKQEAEQSKQIKQEEEKVYTCACEFSTPDLSTFRSHIVNGVREDGKGVHRSLHTKLQKPIIEKPPKVLQGGNGDEPPEDEIGSPKATAKLLGGNGEKSTPKKLPPTTDIREAVRIRVVPREFVLATGTIFFQAMEAAINEWGWPKDISPQDFLDTFLYKAYKQRGITLGGYAVEEEKQEVVAS